MREVFSLEIYTNGRAAIYIRTPDDRLSESVGHEVTPEGGIDPEIVNRLLLEMLSKAYYIGYTTAVEDGKDAVSRLLLENSAPRCPAPKISERHDWGKNA